jgi:hypothetical protein
MRAENRSTHVTSSVDSLQRVAGVFAPPSGTLCLRPLWTRVCTLLRGDGRTQVLDIVHGHGCVVSAKERTNVGSFPANRERHSSMHTMRMMSSHVSITTPFERGDVTLLPKVAKVNRGGGRPPDVAPRHGNVHWGTAIVVQYDGLVPIVQVLHPHCEYSTCTQQDSYELNMPRYACMHSQRQRTL